MEPELDESACQLCSLGGRKNEAHEQVELSPQLRHTHQLYHFTRSQSELTRSIFIITALTRLSKVIVVICRGHRHLDG